MARIDRLDPGVLRRICDVLGDTATGFTGRQIAELLREGRIDDPGDMTKRDRLYEALSARQNNDNAANAIVYFLQVALAPARFLHEPGRFEAWRREINEALSFAALSITEGGKVVPLDRAASTISEARARANRFRDALRERGVHHLVIASCASEIADENYFHAVFETTKGLADRVRDLSGLSEDGVPLVERAFGRAGGQFPVLALNRLDTVTDKSEHDGYAYMLRGLFGAFRNTTAHRPKTTWPIAEQDALDMMSAASLLHRCLDNAVPVPTHLRTTQP